MEILLGIGLFAAISFIFGGSLAPKPNKQPPAVLVIRTTRRD